MIKSKYGYTYDKSVKSTQENEERKESTTHLPSSPSSSSIILPSTSNSFLSYMNKNVKFSLKKAHCYKKVKDLLALYPWPFSQDIGDEGKRGDKNEDEYENYLIIEGGIDGAVDRDNGWGRRGIAGAHAKEDDDDSGRRGLTTKGKQPGRGGKNGGRGSGKGGSGGPSSTKGLIESNNLSSKNLVNISNKNSKEKILPHNQTDKSHAVKSGPSFSGERSNNRDLF
jgi:hypothetical protein